MGALLKVERLSEFTAMFEQRLREYVWSPLDWVLAHEPFGQSGTLRLITRNGFCIAGGGLGTGSDHNEIHASFVTTASSLNDSVLQGMEQSVKQSIKQSLKKSVYQSWLPKQKKEKKEKKE